MASTTESQPGIDLGRLAPDLGVTCGDYLAGHREALEAAIRRGEGGLKVASLHARALDGLLGALHCASGAAARRVADSPLGRVALVAVGGYGRGELGLHSDVDVSFLCDDPHDMHVGGLAEGVLYPIWDLGQRIGHAVRGIDDTLSLARNDLRTATTLLDMRWVAGDRGIVKELAARARGELFGPGLPTFLDALTDDTVKRHARFGDSLYLLEPEVKLGRGGLRDVDVALWAAKARWNARTWDELVRLGVLLPRELAELLAARDLLWRVRNALHLRAGRLQDRLTFADQEEIASAMGLADSLRDGLAVERFMQTYYRHAQRVAQASERMLDRARPRAHPRVRRKARSLGDGTAVFDGKATLVDGNGFDRTPALALRLYRTVVEHGVPPEPFARDTIARAAARPEWRAIFREDDEVVSLFLGLLTHVGDAPVRRGSIVGELHEVGLVGALFPEIDAVTGRVQHDLYHVYTVDVHSIMTVELLRRLSRGALRREHEVASQLAAEAPRRVPLFLAALLHDVGKTGGRGHARRGAALAETAARRIGLSRVDSEHVGWLVARHLDLYHWATRRDVADPEVVDEIGKSVGTVERLRDLYLLTVADVTTTHPGAMNAWKTRMLDQTLTAVTHALEAGVVPDAAHRASELRRALLDEAGDQAPGHASRLQGFLDQMPDRYVLSTPREAIRDHARAFADPPTADPDRLGLLVRPGASVDVDELVVTAPDRPGLLADITAVLAANRLAVQAAEIYTRRGDGDRVDAFDVFQVRGAGTSEERLRDGRLLPRVERDLRSLTRHEGTVEELLERIPRSPAWARRHVPEVATEVRVDNATSSRFTVVDVFTRDRLGLLHTVARAIHDEGLSIALSRVNTEGHRAADVFYVTDGNGEKVGDPARLSRLSVVLRETILAFHASFDPRPSAAS